MDLLGGDVASAAGLDEADRHRPGDGGPGLQGLEHLSLVGAPPFRLALFLV